MSKGALASRQAVNRRCVNVHVQRPDRVDCALCISESIGRRAFFRGEKAMGPVLEDGCFFAAGSCFGAGGHRTPSREGGPHYDGGFQYLGGT